MLTKEDIENIQYFDDAISQAIAYHYLSTNNKNRLKNLIISLYSIFDKYNDIKFTLPEIIKFSCEYEKEINEDKESIKSNEMYKKMLIKINDTDLSKEIKLAFRKNEFVYLGDICVCNPMLLNKLQDWDNIWHIPVRKELKKHGLDFCTKLRNWPFIRRTLQNA